MTLSSSNHTQVQVAIIGAGPGGLAAATNAAHHKLSHVLFEKSEIANTIFEYQLRKHVMAEPNRLPLRAHIEFEAGSREEILDSWIKSLEKFSVNVRRSEVLAITKEGKGTKEGEGFVIKSPEGEVRAEKVILAIGLQGSPRKLGAEGDTLPHVAYTLRDPDEFKDLDIIVVGAGDAAIENAIALSTHNRVVLINRRDEFPRAKDANVALILDAIKSGKVTCYYNSEISKVEPGFVMLEGPQGQVKIKGDRIIARLGAVPPRKFLESCGIQFPSKDANAVPVVNSRYECNVPGLYLIGSLIGYPLIKQAINQGYEAIEHILGNEVEPADEVLIAETIKPLGGTVKEKLPWLRERLPLFSGLSDPQFRELLIDSAILPKKKGSIIFERNDYTDTFFTVLEGSVHIELPQGGVVELEAGQFFGEMGLLSGRRRTATVRMGIDGSVLETPRKQILKLIAQVESVKRAIDERFVRNALQTQIFPGIRPELLNEIVSSATLRNFKKGEVLFREGDEGDVLYVIRKGSVKVSRRNKEGRDVAVTYLPAGRYVGEMALMSETALPRTATVTAAVPCETIVITKETFQKIMKAHPELYERVEQLAAQRTLENLTSELDSARGSIIDFLVGEGITDAENVLIINSDLCIACDNCEKACAATHKGYSRLDRKGGKSFASVQVPISCRHCENPLCMLDCPPDALERKPDGEVVIKDSCIGCGNCVRNCPYGVIQMVYEKPSAFSVKGMLKLLSVGKEEKGVGRAGKCDMCSDLSSGPACVRSCPTGAALRVNPQRLFQIIEAKNRA